MSIQGVGTGGYPVAWYQEKRTRQSALNWLADTAPELMNPGQGKSEDETKTTVGKKAPLSYFRHSTANFVDEEFGAAWEKDDGSKKAENRYWEQNFEQIGARAPESVKQAWMEAAEAAGADGMGASKNGKLTHISQFMVQKVLRQWRGENADDILGSSVQSAIRAVNEALYALEHPLEPHRALTPEAAKGKENEKKFYLEFLKRLEGLQDNSGTATEETKKEVKKETKNKSVNESKTDTEIITQPDGSKILLIKMNIGDMESVMSVELSKPTPFSDKQKDAPADTEEKNTAAAQAQDNPNNQSEA